MYPTIYSVFLSFIFRELLVKKTEMISWPTNLTSCSLEHISLINKKIYGQYDGLRGKVEKLVRAKRGTFSSSVWK